MLEFLELSGSNKTQRIRIEADEPASISMPCMTADDWVCRVGDLPMSKIHTLFTVAACFVGIAGVANATPAMDATCKSLLSANPDKAMVVVAVEGLGSSHLFTCSSKEAGRKGHVLLQLGSMDEVNALIDSATAKVGSNTELPALAYDDE